MIKIIGRPQKLKGGSWPSDGTPLILGGNDPMEFCTYGLKTFLECDIYIISRNIDNASKPEVLEPDVTPTAILKEDQGITRKFKEGGGICD